MNKILAFTAITMVAVILGMSTIAPVIPQAEAMKIGQILVKVETADARDHAKCTVSYNAQGRTVSQTHSTNAKGEALFSIHSMESVPVLIDCIFGEIVFPTETRTVQPEDYIEVLLRP